MKKLEKMWREGALMISPLGERACFTRAHLKQAWEETGGKIPTVAAFRDMFIGSSIWKHAQEFTTGGWLTKDIIICPKPGSTFKKDTPVFDPVSNISIAPEVLEVIRDSSDSEIFGVEKIGVVIRPCDVFEKNGKTIIEPKEARIIKNFVDKLSRFSKTDEVTEIPAIEVDEDTWKKLEPEDRGWLFGVTDQKRTEDYVRPAIVGIKYKKIKNGRDQTDVNEKGHTIDRDFCRFIGPKHWEAEGFNIAVVGNSYAPWIPIWASSGGDLFDNIQESCSRNIFRQTLVNVERLESEMAKRQEEEIKALKAQLFNQK